MEVEYKFKNEKPETTFGDLSIGDLFFHEQRVWRKVKINEKFVGISDQLRWWDFNEVKKVTLISDDEVKITIEVD